MAWYNAGNGAGVWSGATKQPHLRNILVQLCFAVNERELAVKHLASSDIAVSSITRSGSTVTVTTGSGHAIATGHRVFLYGADQAAYNGLQTVTSAADSTHFTFTVGSAPTTPATGTIKVRQARTKFTYDKDHNTKSFPVANDFVDFPIHNASVHAGLSVSSLSHALNVVTALVHGHAARAGDWVKIEGANEAGYNGEMTVLATPVAVAVTSVTRSGSTVTVTTTTPHLMESSDIAYMAGASPTDYNGPKVITKTGANTFTFTVSGTPASPASGTITTRDYSRFTYATTGVVATATGTITAKFRRNKVYYASWAANVATIHSRSHGLTGWIHIEHDSDSTWRQFLKATGSTTHTIDFATTTSLSAQTYSDSAEFWCTRPVGVSLVIMQLREAIESLLAGTEDALDLRFVEDDPAYETTYTLANVLGAGSFGSAWLSMVNCTADDLGDRLEQIREALDVMVIVSANLSGETAEISESEGSIVITLGNQDDAWDEMLADSPLTVGPTSLVGGFSQEYRDRDPFTDAFFASAWRDADVDFAWTEFPGTFVYGSLTLQEYNDEDVDSDDLVLTDGDADVWTFSAALGTAGDLVRKEKTSGWFSASPKTLNFNWTLPSTTPCGALAITQFSERLARVMEDVAAPNAGVLVRELVVGTHLTYG